MDINFQKDRILLQLSGGKDSVACLVLLKDEGADVEAIHFVHSFCYDLPTQMCKKVCTDLNVNLHIIDISQELESLFLNNFYDRPCRSCKSIMDQKTVDFAQLRGFNTICVGDTADDSMLIQRAVAIDGSISATSRYFNSKVVLPQDVVIYRPLIAKSSSYAISLVKSRFPDFKRVNDTGDKYFEYSREGCPLQFKDLGVCYTKELMAKLKKMNLLCSEFATNKGIKASIHLPSENIVTIPEGYEDECRRFLSDNGCSLKKEILPETNIHMINLSIRLYEIINVIDFLKLAMTRFCERMRLKIIYINLNENSIDIVSDDTSVFATYNKSFSLINIVIETTSLDVVAVNFKNICLEIFHSNKINFYQTLIK